VRGAFEAVEPGAGGVIDQVDLAGDGQAVRVLDEGGVGAAVEEAIEGPGEGLADELLSGEQPVVPPAALQSPVNEEVDHAVIPS
jgi:hypothetical protein